jgi:quercetin dioxygenase-like cupin family protein
MAYKHKQIVNTVTGQSIKFLQTAKDTNGQLLEMEATFNKKSKQPAPHYHPYQHETFAVMQGALSMVIDGVTKVLWAGETIQIPANTVHSMWNNSGSKTVVNWKVQPALTTEYFLENATGLAAEGRTNRQGMPGLLQVAIMANKFSNSFRLAKPSFFIQKIVFSILSPVAYLCGYRAAYKKYEN